MSFASNKKTVDAGNNHGSDEEWVAMTNVFAGRAEASMLALVRRSAIVGGLSWELNQS